ncbi:hypothetical protein BE11_06270 [Sorangium cellulosum]|nr:hypothetical protein BE11_06270 [Sorangium cellulosum]
MSGQSGGAGSGWQQNVEGWVGVISPKGSPPLASHEPGRFVVHAALMLLSSTPAGRRSASRPSGDCSA